MTHTVHRHITVDSFTGSLAKGRILKEGHAGQIAAVVWGARTKQGVKAILEQSHQ